MYGQFEQNGLCEWRDLFKFPPFGSAPVPHHHVCIVPIFYMAMFGIHFLILENSGYGDEFMSSEFQRTLQVGGRDMADTFADVAIESKVTGTVTIRYGKAVIFTRIPTIILAAVNSNRTLCNVPSPRLRQQL